MVCPLLESKLIYEDGSVIGIFLFVCTDFTCPFNAKQSRSFTLQRVIVSLLHAKVIAENSVNKSSVKN